MIDGGYLYYRLRTPDGTAVSCRTASPYGGGLYLSVGMAGRLALATCDGWAAVATLTAALTEGGAAAPEWARVPLLPSGPGERAPRFQAPRVRAAGGAL